MSRRPDRRLRRLYVEQTVGWGLAWLVGLGSLFAVALVVLGAIQFVPSPPVLIPAELPVTERAANRLLAVNQSDGANGFQWDAIYDALGRRLQTIYQLLTNNVPDAPSRTLGQILRANVLTPVNAVVGVLKSAPGGGDLDVRRVEFVGPQAHGRGGETGGQPHLFDVIVEALL